MPTSIPNEAPAKQAGFTLVELMVIMFLIGLAATAVVLTVGSVKAGAGSQAEQFAARVAALRDRAVVEAHPFAFWVRPSGYGFESRREKQWQPLNTKPFETKDWQAPLAANITGKRFIRISFDENGLPSTPLDLTLSGGTAPLKIRLDAAGNVDVAR